MEEYAFNTTSVRVDNTCDFCKKLCVHLHELIQQMISFIAAHNLETWLFGKRREIVPPQRYSDFFQKLYFVSVHCEFEISRDSVMA